MKKHYTSFLLMAAMATQPVVLANPILANPIILGVAGVVTMIKDRFIQRLLFPRYFRGYESLEPVPSFDDEAQKQEGSLRKVQKMTKKVAVDLGVAKGDGEYRKRATRRWQARCLSTAVVLSTMLSTVVASVFYVPLLSEITLASAAFDALLGLRLVNRLHKEARGETVMPNAHLEVIAMYKFTGAMMGVVMGGVIGLAMGVAASQMGPTVARGMMSRL